MLREAGRPRVDAVAKVTGRASYAADVHVAGQLEAGLLRSRRPHATVRSIDVAAARRLPGVHAVLTAAELGEMSWYDGQSSMLTDVARFTGDELAVVAAESHAIVDEALALLHVDDEPLGHVTDPFAALDPDAPLVHDGEQSNQLGDTDRYQRGDVDAALAVADVTVTATYTTPAQIHHALESHGAMAMWDGQMLTAYVSTQSIHDVRDGLAEALHLPVSRVRVITEHMGGGFGAKQVVWKPTVLAAVLATRTGRPVRLLLDRHGEALAAGHRNATRQTVRLGADADGRLVAIDADLLVGAGAYTVGGESSAVEGPYQYLYRCANVRTAKATVRTNHGPAVAFRAPGYVEGTFALESAIDELAVALAIDPIELRRRNLTNVDQVDDKPLSSPDALATCLRRAAETFGWDDGGDSDSDSDTDPGDNDAAARRRRGRGFAAHDWVGGKSHPPAFAHVALTPDGSVQVVTGTQDIGTGTRTVLAAVAADALGIDVERITVALGDTAHGLHAPVSAGSSTVPTMAPAVHAAAVEAHDALLDAAAEHLGVGVADVKWNGTTFHHPDGTAAELVDVLAAIEPRRIIGFGRAEDASADVSVRTFGAVCAEVVVDVDTGEITVVRVVCAPDCGRLINSLLAESQVIGGVTQGLGFALSEHEVIDHRLGIVLNANLEDYLVPTMADRCEIVHAAVNRPDEAANSLGNKGLGELPMIAVAPAIANAIYDAVGLRIRDLPITRRRLLDAVAAGATP